MSDRVDKRHACSSQYQLVDRLRRCASVVISESEGPLHLSRNDYATAFCGMRCCIGFGEATSLGGWEMTRKDLPRILISEFT